MDEVELYREQILRHVSPVITGRFAGYQAAYTREVRVGQPLLIVVFFAAGIGIDTWTVIVILATGSCVWSG